MEALAVQDGARNYKTLPSPLPVPEEIMVNIVRNLLSRTTNLLNPVYLGSRALTSAEQIRRRLRSLCLVSQRMNGIVTPYLYRIIFITDSNKLTRLHQTLEKDPVLYGYLELFAVHQNVVPTQTGEGRKMSPSEFSNTVFCILKKAPRLARFSLVPTGMKVLQDAPPPYLLPLGLMPQVLTRAIW